ncbi:MAG: alpha/beta hydrolase-fold protein [Verrucomicrobia bacterium]|jgi:predicted alpha/beta superfamily hydrolase|nr:alpha/beta hydrolase-fold protein [Verrucomicrobiota bacterium]
MSLQPLVQSAAWLSGALAMTALASSWPVVQPFALTNDVGFGNSVFVSGNHPDLGADNPLHAHKLRWTTGSIWTGQVAVAAGAQVQYRFIRRSTDPTVICNPSNSTVLTGDFPLTLPSPPPAPFAGKTILYHSTWPQAFILYRSGTHWISAAMAREGDGRSPGESLFRVSGIGTVGEELEFVPNDGAGQWDNPAGGVNYLTPLDVFFVQDKQVFNVRPPVTVSAPAIQTSTVNSTVPGIASRMVRVLLPRGYTQNTAKRYPVLYLHDGQNVFDPGGPYGSWSADATVARETGQGRMRECIVVGVDNSVNRILEYLPPTDAYGGSAGLGDKYRDYLLNNVRPYINTTYRTLTESSNTLTAGSSMGGLIALYLGRSSTNFGRIAILSPAFWTAPNYMAQVRAGAKGPGQVYLDMGTAETTGAWNDALAYYDTLLLQSYAPGADMRFVVGCGDQHNEAAWKKRLPGVLQFLLDPRDEAAPLALVEWPPRLEVAGFNAGESRLTLRFPSLFGVSYELQGSTDLLEWGTTTTTPVETLPWSWPLIDEPLRPSPGPTFWRLRCVVSP